MSDLISRSELIKEIDKYCGNQKYLVSENIRQIIENQQTTYDIDGVVEELEKELSLADKKKERCTGENYLQFDSAKGYASGISTAIEIVKQGGVSDDVCEWEYDYKFVSDKYKRETGCGHTFYDLHHAVPFNKHCPYCGKKIKIVGD